MRLQQHIRKTTVLTNSHAYYVRQSQNTGCIWRIERKPLCKSPLCLLCLSILKTTAVEPAICTPSWTSLPAWRPVSYALSLFFISFFLNCLFTLGLQQYVLDPGENRAPSTLHPISIPFPPLIQLHNIPVNNSCFEL